MTWWSIEPHDPLMIRDGRPFGVDTDGARSLDFPTPSAVAGTLRTRIGFDGNPGTFGLTVAQALEISVRGPILADASSDRMWLPAPRDAVLFEAEAHGDWPRYRLQPGAAWADGESSLPNTLLPVEGVVALPTTKTAKDAPAFWSDTALRAWLSAPASTSTTAPSPAPAPTSTPSSAEHA